MKAETKRWTYKDYLKIEDDKRYEIIKGELIMVPSPSVKHQEILAKIFEILLKYIKEKKLGKLFIAPLDVILSEDIVLQPDILFVSNDNLNIIKEKGIFGSPDLLIEIISPTTLKIDLEDKREIYEKFKVKEYWIVFPEEKAIEILYLEENKYKVIDFKAEKGKVKSKLTGIEIDLKDIF